MVTPAPREEIAIAYDRVASFYDETYTRPSDVRENAAIADWLLGAPRPILDLGCGTGLVADLCRPGLDPWEYLGVDIAPEMIFQAKRKHPHLDFRLGDMADLDGAGNFGTLVSLFSIQYHPNPARMLWQAALRMHATPRVLIVAYGPDHPGSRALDGKQLGDRYPPAKLLNLVKTQFPQARLWPHFKGKFTAVEA